MTICRICSSLELRNVLSIRTYCCISNTSTNNAFTFCGSSSDDAILIRISNPSKTPTHSVVDDDRGNIKYQIKISVHGSR